MSFRAEIKMGGVKFVVEADAPEPEWEGAFTWAVVPDGVGGVPCAGTYPLASVIPSLELLLETAKMIVNKEAQEATNGE